MTGEWRKQAACAGPDVNPDLWFAIPPGHLAADSVTHEALRICRACPVRDQCLEEALEQGEEFGVWGGLLPLERRLYAEGVSACGGCGRSFHRRHRLQTKCGYCRAKAGNTKRTPPRCGTKSGYSAHRSRGETACPRCSEANAAYTRAYRQKAAS